MRLQKYMASCGVAARRKCEDLIREGRVTVNGAVVTEMGIQVEAGDIVTVDGALIQPEEQKVTILYYKPFGEVTTVSDDKGRETVLDRFKGFPVRLYPVGRLDYDSEGLLLLTNDGALAQRLTHPSSEVDKTYVVRFTGQLTSEELTMLRDGVLMEGDQRRTWPAEVHILRSGEIWTEALVTIHEGRNRQVRRMLAAVGHQVVYLRRVRFGPLELGRMKRGEWRILTPEELHSLEAL